MGKRAFLVLLALVGNLATAAPATPMENCGFEVPEFWDEIYEKFYVNDGRDLIATGVFAGLRDVLKKPVTLHANAVAAWIKGHSIRDVCIIGDLDDRQIKVVGKALVFVPEEYADEDAKGVQILAVEARFLFDPDRTTVQLDSYQGFTVMDITLAFRNMLDPASRQDRTVTGEQ